MTRIGQTGITCGRYGCLITSISMMTNEFGKYRSPGELCRDLQFTSEGLLLWQSLGLIGLKLEKRFYKYDLNTIKAALLSKDQAVTLQVDGYHWVWLTSKVPGLELFNTVDPWPGKWKVYGPGRITGGAIISNISL